MEGVEKGNQRKRGLRLKKRRDKGQGDRMSVIDVHFVGQSDGVTWHNKLKMLHPVLYRKP